MSDSTINERDISVLAHQGRRFDSPADTVSRAHINSLAQYESEYARSIEDPDGFWAEKATEYLSWYKPWEKVVEADFLAPKIEWFKGASLNVSYNCVDRHVEAGKGDVTAFIWEGDGGEVATITYSELQKRVARFANVLRARGVRKGDRVTLYLPMIPELAIAMLACARIGAVHTVVFGGFSAHSLGDRIHDCGAEVVITADEGVRGGKAIPLKAAVDAAIEEFDMVHTVLVVRHTDSGDITMVEGRDHWLDEELAADGITDICEPVHVDAEDPLFILYTSGSTGKPKGVLHTSGGYLLHAAMSFKLIFDWHPGDIHFCTADIGWVTGHSYVVYGPLANGATSIIYEGLPSWPAPDRLWQVTEKHSATTLYTAPTVIRSLMREGDDWADKHELKSLRLLGSVGEPINPEAWLWYHEHVGKGILPVVDTWWQTETGGILITQLPGVATMKPGSAWRPFFGVSPKVIRENGTECGVDEGGYLVIDKPWPGMMRGTYGDPTNARMKEVYFSQFPGYYVTGDGAHKDADGDYWLAGRIDDVVNVSGHRLSTAEVESALVSHCAVAESAVVGYPHDLKGEGIAAYVILRDGVLSPGGSEGSVGADGSGRHSPEELVAELRKHVRQEIGPIATPDRLMLVDGLPKTRSGKIMRRILRKIARGELGDLGDTSTLADPSVVDGLIEAAAKG